MAAPRLMGSMQPPVRRTRKQVTPSRRQVASPHPPRAAAAVAPHVTQLPRYFAVLYGLMIVYASLEPFSNWMASENATPKPRSVIPMVKPGIVPRAKSSNSPTTVNDAISDPTTIRPIGKRRPDAGSSAGMTALADADQLQDEGVLCAGAKQSQRASREIIHKPSACFLGEGE